MLAIQTFFENLSGIGFAAIYSDVLRYILPLLALLREQAVEMQESGKRSHYSNYETLLRRHFSKNAFFFTPEAVGFFYQPNTLGISDKPFVYLLPRGTLRERELFKSTTF